ncbi:hypothetical protein BCT30_11210 [Enterovibrio norvegicus]|uniref:Uncharacterized protein n=2 Tax=Enterovibrio norvegicus TaxID=188144 RepID=A0A1I5P131_9GAMM|nr:DUF6482 family protein [Enterovibrio norvegicus]MCC4799709.1 DUF6482 family protein [Enterovibrio norvegicus]OEE51720.1 hypothetical protein A1OS_05385 [Enterovibrio norvegicus]OEF54823.1 hypothetical protein A1OU_20680 [Enterovibrio norvegicus]OEF59204.1 hypothetical protein A1OW_05350 [Enterovibrio norvegicus]PMH71103.1 hypothetical protein BCU62_05595 [Enterovibrio norvegicus]
MKLKQLKNWILSHPDNVPHCYVVAHAGGAKYIVEVEVRHQLEPLKDDKHDEVMHFDSIEQVSDKLRKIGVKKVTLRLLDPYDEFGPADTSCKEDMEITL